MLFDSVFVVISSLPRLTFANLCLFSYIFLLGSVFSSLTSSETSLSITRPCYLCCYVPDGLHPLKPRVRFRFLGYIRRLSKKQNKTKNERELQAFYKQADGVTPFLMHLYSDKARCFNQSGRALYRNFIIKYGRR